MPTYFIRMNSQEMAHYITDQWVAVTCDVPLIATQLALLHSHQLCVAVLSFSDITQHLNVTE